MKNTKSVIFTCPTLKGELMAALKAAGSTVPVTLLPQELHSSPPALKAYLQDKIDALQDTERAVICVSGCGGSTTGLRASTAELILPRTRDCVDILLSAGDYRTIDRKRRVYMTASWFEHHQNSSLNLEKLVAAKGKEEAEAFLRRLYKGFEEFYVIDTGAYDVRPVIEGLTPFVKVLGGSITVIRSDCGLLHKLARGDFDDNFLRVPRGGTVPAGFYLPNP